MPIELRPVTVPDFGLPIEQPTIPAATYQTRCERAYKSAACDWLVVYADREHFANMMFLSGFEPRFEEALLLLGPGQRRILLVGIECFSYAQIAALPGLEIVLCPSLSLMGLDRSSRPTLHALLKEAGLSAGQSFGIVGWKYLDSDEWEFDEPTFFVPSFVIDTVKRIAGKGGRVVEATPILMHPSSGLRAAVDADQIVLAEWGASRASAAVWRVVGEVCEGDSELIAASRMAYAGEPMNAHVMMSSGDASGPVLGLKSPTTRQLRRGDGAVSAISYWGGLSARAGLVDTGNDAFLRLAGTYMEAIIEWYAATDVGVAGGEVFDRVAAKLAGAGLVSALNPGHISGHDEWMHTPIRKGSREAIASGSLFQVDISPTPMRHGWALSCIDSVVIADAPLREELRRRHPQVYLRMLARRTFMRDEIGVDLKESILPLSSAPLCLPPFWLTPGMLLAVT